MARGLSCCPRSPPASSPVPRPASQSLRPARAPLGAPAPTPRPLPPSVSRACARTSLSRLAGADGGGRPRLPVSGNCLPGRTGARTSSALPGPPRWPWRLPNRPVSPRPPLPPASRRVSCPVLMEMPHCLDFCLASTFCTNFYAGHLLLRDRPPPKLSASEQSLFIWLVESAAGLGTARRSWLCPPASATAVVLPMDGCPRAVSGQGERVVAADSPRGGHVLLTADAVCSVQRRRKALVCDPPAFEPLLWHGGLSLPGQGGSDGDTWGLASGGLQRARTWFAYTIHMRVGVPF